MRLQDIIEQIHSGRAATYQGCTIISSTGLSLVGERHDFKASIAQCLFEVRTVAGEKLCIPFVPSCIDMTANTWALAEVEEGDEQAEHQWGPVLICVRADLAGIVRAELLNSDAASVVHTSGIDADNTVVIYAHIRGLPHVKSGSRTPRGYMQIMEPDVASGEERTVAIVVDGIHYKL